MKIKRTVVVLAILSVLLVSVAFIFQDSLLGYLRPPFQSSTNEQAVAGTVTRKFTDCQGGEQLDSATNIPKAIPLDEVTCDLGSTLTVDGKHEFITSSGKTSQDMTYSVDVSDIKVGDNVLVRYKLQSDGSKTLDCDICGVEKVLE